MAKFRSLALLAVGAAAGIASVYFYAHYSPELLRFASHSLYGESPFTRPVLYYRHPNSPYWSALPKKDEQRRDYLPVYEDNDAVSKETPGKGQGEESKREILYYRNPMGLPDTSPGPKKDPMGMDYIPVFADEDVDAKTVKVSLDKVQRSGVRTEKAQSRVLSSSVRAAGTVEHDKSLLTVVTVRSDGYVEELFVNKTGQHVKEGEPLFRFYSPQFN